MTSKTYPMSTLHIFEHVSLFMLVTLLIALGITYLAIRDYMHAKETIEWPTVNGTIIEASYDKELSIKLRADVVSFLYEYRIENKMYRSNKVYFSDYLADCYQDYIDESPAQNAHIDEPVAQGDHYDESSLDDDYVDESPAQSAVQAFRECVGWNPLNLTRLFHRFLSIFPAYTDIQRELAELYNVNDEIKLRVDPKNPQVSVIRPGISSAIYIALGINIYISLTLFQSIMAVVLEETGTSSVFFSLLTYLLTIGWIIGLPWMFFYLTGMIQPIVEGIKSLLSR